MENMDVSFLKPILVGIGIGAWAVMSLVRSLRQSHYYNGFNVGIFPILIVVGIVGLLLYIPSTQNSKDNVPISKQEQKEQTNQVEQIKDTPYQNASPRSVGQKMQPKLATFQQHTHYKEQKASRNVPSDRTNNDEYFIQLGAYSVLENALKTRQKWAQQVHNTVSVGITTDGTTTNYKVLITGFNTKVEADLFSNRINKGYAMSATNYTLLEG